MQKFSLGAILATPRVLEKIGELGVNRVIDRHKQGDWGEVGADSISINNEAVESGVGDILSIYTINGCTVWVQTYIGENTTVLLPEEY